MPYKIDATGARYAYEKGSYLPHYKSMGTLTKRSISSRSRAGNVSRQVKLCMRRLAEKKHLTTSLNQTPVAAAGTFINLPILSQGTSATTRVGNQIHITEIEVFGGGFLPATNAYDVVRMIILVDHEPLGAAPAVADVLESANYLAPYNKDKVKPRGRFTVLFDQYLDLNQQAATVTAPVKTLHFKKKMETSVFYQSNAGTISDVLKNNITCLFLSAGGLANFAGNAQLCYTDL